MSSAGWYPDPYARFDYRYFDGAGWTAYASMGDRQVIDPDGAGASQPPAQFRPPSPQVHQPVGPAQQVIEPLYTYAAHHSASQPIGNGMAVAALVLGLIGALAGLIPLFFFIALPLGVLAIVFGVAGRRASVRRQAPRKAMAVWGLVLGILAVVLGFVGIAIIDEAVDDLSGGDSSSDSETVSEALPGVPSGDVATGATVGGTTATDEAPAALASVEKSGFVTYGALGGTWANVGALVRNNTSQDLFSVQVTYNFIAADGTPVATESSYLDVLPANDSMPTSSTTATDLTPFLPVTVEVTVFADEESIFERDWAELQVGVPDPRVIADQIGRDTVSGTVSNTTADPIEYYVISCLVLAPDGSVLGGFTAGGEKVAPGQTVAWQTSGTGDFEAFTLLGATVANCRAIVS